MKNFTYHIPTKIYFGKGEEQNTGAIIKQYGFSRVLVHFGKGSVKASGLLARVEASLTAAGIDFIELGGVEPNPKTTLVEEGAALCRKEKIDFILAVGGGSVLDSAKVMAICAVHGGAAFDYPSKKAEAKAGLPVGTILTLAASGSEMSQSAVLTHVETMVKRGFNAPCNRPLFSILNPELTYTVSPYQTACGIVDIIMHTLERYFSPGQGCALTDGIALSLVRTVVDAGRAAMQNPSDFEARATLMWAGSLSHNDLTGLGKDTFLVVHQLEHVVSGDYDFVAHGAGLAALFPAFCKYIYTHDLQKFAQYARVVWDVPSAPLEEMAWAGIEKTEAYFREIGMPVRLQELGIENANYGAMAEKCTFYGTRVLPGIVPLDKPEIEEIFRISDALV